MAGHNPSGIKCVKKNNRVVLNGYIVHTSDVAPNQTVIVGTIDELGRPTRVATIIVGVLGNDVTTQGITIGELGTNGEIKVMNPLNINSKHFYFDVVWDI